MKIAVTQRYDKYKYNEGEWLLSNNNKKMFDSKNISLIQVNDTKNISEVVKICDGLFIPGGADINPKLYGEEVKGTKEFFDEVDALDYAYIKAFHEAGKPILGICRGHQIINVFFGGSLIQHIDKHVDCWHEVEVTKASFIDEIYHSNKLKVNSWHHQVVKEVAPGFEVVAKSVDGYIEALHKDNIYTVQWHPEMYDGERFITYFFEKVFNK